MIIFDQQGKPMYVPSESAAVGFLRKGYTKEQKEDKQGSTAVAYTQESEPGTETDNSISEDSDNELSIRINFETLAKISKIDGLSVTKARKIIAAQPNIKSSAELKKIAEEIDWDKLIVDGKPVTINYSNVE